MTFANFPELSIDVEQQEQIIGSEEKADDEEAVEEESELYEQSLMLSEDPSTTINTPSGKLCFSTPVVDGRNSLESK